MVLAFQNQRRKMKVPNKLNVGDKVSTCNFKTGEWDKGVIKGVKATYFVENGEISENNLYEIYYDIWYDYDPLNLERLNNWSAENMVRKEEKNENNV